jgi:hypothetical protein
MEKILKSKLKQDKTNEKQMIKFIPEMDESIKLKLQSIASKGHGATQPKVITIEEIKKAINEWKLENQIYSQEITLNNCMELSLSFRKILQISNLENLIKLEKLKLDNNMIMKIENLDHLVNLKWLDLSFNNITKLEGLDKLENLLDLSIYNNQIQEVEGLDCCRKLNVLSIGRNLIKNPKDMVSYLRKFSNLQALNVADNPFCKEDTTMQLSIEQHLQQKSIYYPASYDVILANLDKLKYLDWKPIDYEKRENAIQSYKNSNQKDRNEANYQNEEKQQKLMKEYAEYKHANIEATIDFYKQFEKKIRDDLIINAMGNETWEKMNKLPGFSEVLMSISKSVEDSLNAYRADILVLQVDKDSLIRLRSREIEDGHEKFVEQSKGLVSNFKREFKTATLNVLPININRIKIEEEIRHLVDKLMKIEVWEKQKISERISEFKSAVKELNEKMGARTSSLKDDLEFHKKFLKENLQNIQVELEKKVDAYNAEEGQETHQKNELMEFFLELMDDDSLWSEIDRINETYEEKISGLKEDLDKARTSAFNKFFDALNEKEYLRNKKRIEDINEISEMYMEKLCIALGADPKKK